MTDQVTLEIYTLTGRLVSQFDILDGFAGYNEFSWDGLDDGGAPLANGAYLLRPSNPAEGAAGSTRFATPAAPYCTLGDHFGTLWDSLKPLFFGPSARPGPC